MKKKIISVALIILILLVTIFIVINIKYIKVLEESTNNTVKSINTNVYKFNLDLTIKYVLYDKKMSSNINYIETSSKNIRKYETYIRENNTLIESFENYSIKYDNKYKYYTKNNTWNYEIIDNINDKRSFNLNYSSFFNNLSEIRKVNEDENYIYYSSKIESYKAYNFIYKDDILSKKDVIGKTKINIKVNKNKNIIENINYEITNIEKDNIKANYKVNLTNDFNNNDIKLPF